MKVEMRKTGNGTEYWDTEEKRTLFVPVGEETDFEVTVNPESMIVGVDLANGSDVTVTTVDLKSMKVEQLREYAASIGVEIPDDVKKKDDIIALLS
jgi:hypothetical protein